MTFAPPERAPDERLALPLGVHVGRVEEVDPGVARRREEVEKAPGILLKYAADSCTPEAPRGNFQIRLAERACLHLGSIPFTGPSREAHCLPNRVCEFRRSSRRAGHAAVCNR